MISSINERALRSHRILMSVFGTKGTLILTLNMSAFGGNADIPDPLSKVRTLG